MSPVASVNAALRISIDNTSNITVYCYMISRMFTATNEKSLTLFLSEKFDSEAAYDVLEAVSM